MPSHLAVVDVSETEPFRIAQVLETSGTLVGIGVISGPGYHDIQVKTDEAELANVRMLDLIYSQAGLSVNLPFERSLEITVRSDNGQAPAKFWASFTTQGSKLLHSEEVICTPDMIPYRLSRLVMQRNEGHPYFVELAVGPANWCRVDLERDVLISGQDLRGRLRFDSGAPNQKLTTSATKLIVRLAGTASVLASPELSNFDDAYHFIWAWNDIEASLTNLLGPRASRVAGPLDLEISTSIAKYVSYPARFRLF